jgi:hypothetical protein
VCRGFLTGAHLPKDFSMTETKPELIPCDDHPKDSRKCGLCNDTGLMRLRKIKLDDGNTEMYVPSNLSQEEAQSEFDRSLDILMNKFSISN